MRLHLLLKSVAFIPRRPTTEGGFLPRPLRKLGEELHTGSGAGDTARPIHGGERAGTQGEAPKG